MYKVLCDGELLCDSGIEELALINPVVKLEENKAGSFTFTIPPGHPKYNAVKRRKSMLQVYRDEELIFSGVCKEAAEDFFKQKKVSCEGELTFFNDSIQRPARYEGMTVRRLLEAYVENHNAQVEENKHFTVGVVTVKDSNDYISCYTNMETTMQALKEDLVDDLGGFFRIRHVDGIRYLDYLAESPNTNSQTIRLGENLMDFESNLSNIEIATAVIPMGAKLDESAVEGLDTRLTIESVNNGLDYVCNQEAVNAYGWIYKTIVFDDVTTPEALKRKGEQYLSAIQFEDVVLKVKAIDLHLADKDVEQFKLLDMVPVVSTPHGLNKHFRLSQMTINLNNPEKDTITLGKSEKLSLSAKSSQANAELKKAIESIVPKSTLLQEAAKNATALIASAMGGYVVKTNNELLIMDTNDIKTAQKVWRWNINGLAYSSTGYDGEYALAMTMDGHIVADFITTGSLSADRVRGGKLIAGGANDKFGSIEVQDDNGNVIGKWTYSGIDAYGKLTSRAVDAWDHHTAIEASVKRGAFYLEDGSGNLLGVLEKHRQSADVDQGGIALLSSMSDIRLGFVFSIDNDENDSGAEVHWSEFYYNMFNPQTSGLNYVHLFRKNAEFTDDVMVDGDFTCLGTSFAQVYTIDHGYRKLSYLATAEAYFSDMGSGVIGYDGTCVINFDTVFEGTIDLTSDYKVFITPTSQSSGLWVAKNTGTFTVYGTEGATFDWAICCKQLDRSNIRLEEVKEG